MNEISTIQVYYAYFNDNQDTIKAYKVIDVVFNIETMRYTLTLNIANEGVKTIVVETWKFFLSPLDVINDKQSFGLMNLSRYVTALFDRGVPYTKEFRAALMKNGFVFDSEKNIRYYYFSGGVLETKSDDVYNIYKTKTPLLVGTYNLLTNELKGVQFNPKAFCNNIRRYKTKQECLKAQMPKVVEFEEQPQNDVEILFNVNVSIKAKNAKDAQRKLALMLQMTNEKFNNF